MQPAAASIVAVALIGSVFASVGEAAIIRGSGTFEVLLLEDRESGEVFDPPLFGSGSFEIRSRPYDPDDVFEVLEFDVLDFSYSFAGFTWDELDAECFCDFTPDGQPRDVGFDFDNGVASGLLIWSFENGVFGMDLFAPNLELRGDSDTSTADGSEIDFHFVVVPEPGSLGLLALGLLGFGLTRRRA